MSRLVFETSCHLQLCTMDKNRSYRGIVQYTYMTDVYNCSSYLLYETGSTRVGFLCPHVPCFRTVASVLPGDSIV